MMRLLLFRVTLLTVVVMGYLNTFLPKNVVRSKNFPLFATGTTNTPQDQARIPESSRYRFGYGKVGEVSAVASTLLGCGFTPWSPLPDMIVIGQTDNWSHLLDLCPYHCNRLPARLVDVNFLLFIDAKLSAPDLVKCMIGSDSQIDTNYWLLAASDSLKEQHKVIFLDGGEDTKQWVLAGGESEQASERLVWNFLRDANISIFYRESFAQDCERDMSTSDARIAKLEAEREKDGARIAKLEAILCALLPRWLLK